ncbi:uracil-DNA glycosylase 2-like [Styela clava]
MSSQRKISSFFNVAQKKTGNLKRPLKEKEICSSAKRPLTESPNNKPVQTHISLKKQTYMDSLGLETIGESWKKALEPEFHKDYFVKLGKFVTSERSSHTVFPPVEDVFSWTQHCKLKDIKVVILGQDPYHGEGQAHGLCFSVKKPVKPPPSLENMFKELKSDIGGFKHPGHGDLTRWAKQGVLLLNAVLTVRAHSANSHKDKGWEKFTDAVIKYVNSNCTGVVFMLWGSYAQKKGAVIDKKRHHVLCSVHPSPLSAYRGFLGCKHFSEANKLLKDQGDKEIDWCAL